MFAYLDERLTIGWMLCPEFSVLKERITVNLFASLARRGIQPLKCVPGTDVGITSPTERTPDGASGLGSNVSC